MPLISIASCRPSRPAAPGAGRCVEWCGHCQYTHIRYRSCRNRHCPKCQGAAREKWLEQRHAELLPTEYFHVVFTLPEPIAAIAFYNKEAVYDFLFRATAKTLLTIARDPERLGVELASSRCFIAGVRTSTFILTCIAWFPAADYPPITTNGFTAAAASFSRSRFSAACSGVCFWKPWKKLAAGQLQFFGDLEPLRDPSAFARYLAPLKKTEWVVYAKAPFGGPQHVLEYLGRYTHRVAISNRRLLALEKGQSLPVERLPGQAAAKGNDGFRRRVHPAIPAACLPPASNASAITVSWPTAIAPKS